MTSNKALVKIGGLLAIVGAAFYIGTQLTNLLLGGQRLLYGALGVLGSVLIVPMAVGFYQFLRDQE